MKTLCSLSTSDPARRRGGTVSTTRSGASTAAAAGWPGAAAAADRRHRRPASGTGGAGQDGRAELAGLVRAQVGQVHRGRSGVGDLEPELSEPENPRQQRLHDVDRLDPVQPGLALLLEQHPGVDAHVPVRHLVAGEVPAQDKADHGQQQHRAAAEHQPRRPPGEPLVEDRAALEQPFEGVAAEKEEHRGQRHPAPDERRGRMHAPPAVPGGASQPGQTGLAAGGQLFAEPRPFPRGQAGDLRAGRRPRRCEA